MKEIVLDTETTGLSIKEGHRIVEIGCIELENLILKKKFSLLFKSKERYQCRFMDIPVNFYQNKKFKEIVKILEFIK